MLLFTIIKLLPTLRLSCQKTYLFPSHFASIWSCSVCLGGIILGKNTVLHLENAAVSNPSDVACGKKRYVIAISDVRGFIEER